jgi:hypothetical protein
MNENQVIKQINEMEGFFETAHKTSFTAFRRAKDGTEKEVCIDILDAGSDTDSQSRYSCEARTENGRMATGNPASSISDVLLTVHWHQLDQESE